MGEHFDFATVLRQQDVYKDFFQFSRCLIVFLGGLVECLLLHENSSHPQEMRHRAGSLS